MPAKNRQRRLSDWQKGFSKVNPVDIANSSAAIPYISLHRGMIYFKHFWGKSFAKESAPILICEK